MPTGHVAYLAVTAVCVALALRPPRRPPLLTRVANVVTPAVNEVPQLFGLMLVASTVLVVLDGDLRRGAGARWLLAAGALTLVALGVLALRGMRARAAVARGLDAAGIAGAGVAAGPLWRWALRVAVTPVPVRPREVERVSDIAYGTDRRQRLDVYRRRDEPRGGPVLLYLHGGGYFSGDKHREARALLHRLAAKGWVCVSATYRLRPAAGYEQHLEDAEAALAWSHRHAPAYGADPSTLVMAGSSAGAHLTALVALRSAAARGGQVPCVTAAVGLYGYYGRYDGRGPDEASPSTPMALDARSAPPFFLVHGDLDVQVPIAGARAFAAKLRAESSAAAVLVELPAGQHGFDLWRSWRTTAVLDGLERFLADRRVLGKGAGAR